MGLESLVAYLASLSSRAVYGTLVLVLLACGLGVPIPEDISLLSAGYLAYLQVVSVHKVMVVCFASVLAGDLFAFFLGHFGGRRLIAGKIGQRFFPPRKQLRARAYFRKFGSKVIFVGRFLPGLRFSIFFSAGMLHVRPAVFLLYDALAAAISVPALVYLASFFGEYIDHVIVWSRRSEWAILGVASAVVLVLALKAERRAKRKLALAQVRSHLPAASAEAGAPGAAAPSDRVGVRP